MDEYKFVGIDVSEGTLDVWLYPTGIYSSFDNNVTGIEELLKFFSSHRIRKIVMEATGNLEYRCALSLQKSGYQVAVINPQFTAAFRTMCGKFTKTDAADAEMLALFAKRMEPEARPISNESEQELKELAARRRQIVTMVSGEKNRLRRSDLTTVKNSIRAIIAALQEEKKSIETQILALIEQIESYRDAYNVLITIPGIGPVVAATFVTALPELGQLNTKQIASLVGVAPHARDSGKTSGKARTRGGRKSVRAVLYMSAITGVKFNPVLKSFYERLVKNGKPKKLALTAVMRKLIIIANNIVKENRAWQNNYSYT